MEHLTYEDDYLPSTNSLESSSEKSDQKPHTEGKDVTTGRNSSVEHSTMPDSPRHMTASILLINMSPNTTEAHAVEIGSLWGQIISSKFVVKGKTNRAILTFATRDQAKEAVDHMHKMTLDHCELQCAFTVDENPATAAAVDAHGKCVTLKEYDDNRPAAHTKQNNKYSTWNERGNDDVDNKRRPRDPPGGRSPPRAHYRSRSPVRRRSDDGDDYHDFRDFHTDRRDRSPSRYRGERGFDRRERRGGYSPREYWRDDPRDYKSRRAPSPHMSRRDDSPERERPERRLSPEAVHLERQRRASPEPYD